MLPLYYNVRKPGFWSRLRRSSDLNVNKLAVLVIAGTFVSFLGLVLLMSRPAPPDVNTPPNAITPQPIQDHHQTPANPTQQPGATTTTTTTPGDEPDDNTDDNADPQQQQTHPEEQQQPQQQQQQQQTPAQQIMQERREAVKEAMKHAWGGYVKRAWGADEVRPVSGERVEWLRLGATIVDSLDTLWIMGLKDEFNQARGWVARSLDFDVARDISVFETTIRVVGGLLSAYDLSKDKMFLDRCKELADKLMPAYESAPNGIPYTTINLHSAIVSNPSWNGGLSILAEAGTVQLEFHYLSHVLNISRYSNNALRVIDILQKNNAGRGGLLPVFIDQGSGRCQDHSPVTLGALGDSYYEYLLKFSLLSRNAEPELSAKFRAWYDEAAASITNRMIKKSGSLTYIAELEGGNPVPKMDHLACFAGAMLAIGSAKAPNEDMKKRQWAAGAGIAEICHEMYARMESGIAPEYITIGANGAINVGASYYILRPEAVETFMVMWRHTHDPKYQEWGWQVFQAIEKHCKAEFGYSGLRDVRSTSPQKDNGQPSYFLAETLKYLYLLFSPDDVIPLDKYVFNTEAHPLSVL